MEVWRLGCPVSAAKAGRLGGYLSESQPPILGDSAAETGSVSRRCVLGFACVPPPLRSASWGAQWCWESGWAAVTMGA